MDERESYEVGVRLPGWYEDRIYYGDLFPGTAYAPDYLQVSIEDYSSVIFGTPGYPIIKTTHYDVDPGYFEGVAEITVTEAQWTISYAGYIYGIPDIYTIRLVPVNGLIYNCR